MLRAAVSAGAMSLVVPVSSAAAQSTATIASTDVKKKRMHVRAGKPVVVTGAAARHRRRGGVAADQARGPLAHARPGAHRRGRPLHAPRPRATADERPGAGTGGDARRRVGRLNVYRTAYVSWYGPGLYGNHLGCGGRLSPRRLGVAHKTLPCGARVTLRRGTRTVRVRVIDRGPYVAGREFDLTQATAERLRFGGHGSILTTR
jgi:rare lipoprotein A (peptidoglycan hydrolase)